MIFKTDSKILEIPGSKSPERDHAVSEWTEALEGFMAHIPFTKWINHPSANAGASHKIDQISRARDKGLFVPETLVTQDPEEVRQFWTKHRGQIVAKPLAGGFIERQDKSRDTVIYTCSVPNESIRNVDLISECPTLFQQKINKVSDVRVCFLDGVVTAVELLAHENGEQRLDIRRDGMIGVKHQLLQIPAKIETFLVELLRSYSLRFAAVDFVVDAEGNWIFLEINPNGQWAWLDLESDANIAEQFIQAFSTT